MHPLLDGSDLGVALRAYAALNAVVIVLRATIINI